MDALIAVYCTAALIALYFFCHVASNRFDPFAPVWMFLVGYVQVYVIQAYKYNDWGVSIRGADVVWAANFRSLWGLLWFLGIYHLPLGGALARVMPTPPRGWSLAYVKAICPILIAWGLVSAGMMPGSSSQDFEEQSAAETLFRSFPFLMLVAASLLIVSGRSMTTPNPGLTAAGIATALCYILIWMYNGKRSHSLMGVLVIVCSYYVTRLRRPSWTVLFATAITGALVVGIAIGWRITSKTDTGFSGFVEFVGRFDPQTILESINVVDDSADSEAQSYETKEYGGFLLMMDVVPAKSEYDYGSNYLRTFSTFIPRIVWPTKPLYGRDKWIGAWIAGSEIERDADFAGPSIGILGATQLNGGAVGAAVVLGMLALVLRSAYVYFRIYEDVALVQFVWSILFFNSWFMVVGDDPMSWFYYNWGYTGLPISILTCFVCKFVSKSASVSISTSPLGV
jgi:hypothetical protein